MKNWYFSFGQKHTHRVNGVTWDCDLICEITATSYEHAREKAFDAFGDQWAFQYSDIEKVGMQYFPRGVLNLESLLR